MSSRRSILAAAWLTLVWSLSAANCLAGPLDPKDYGITARPEPGPVMELQPDQGLPPIPFGLPFDWGMDPYNDRTWRFRLHTVRMVDKALAAGDFDFPREVFLDWQRWHENCWWTWPLCLGRTTDQSWDDMATGIRASRLAYLLRSTDWQDERLVELAEQHAAKLQEPEFFAGNHNHALFQLQGLAALCLDHKLSACAGADTFIERGLEVVLHGQFTAAGMHVENSPEYHFFAAEHLSRMAPLLERFAPDYAAILQQAESNYKWLVHPDLTLVQLGDSNAELNARWRRKLNIPEGEPACRDVRSYRQSPDCYLIKHFEDAGYVIVRSDWAIPSDNASMLFVQGGFFNDTHRDADDFSFEWFERGRKIITDSGKYIVVSADQWRDYFDTTRAHNTVEVDGEDYSRSDPYGNAVERAERTRDDIRIELGVEHVAREVHHQREIEYQPGQQLTIRDNLSSDRPRRYVQWHHFAGPFELTGGAGRFQASDGEVVIDVEVSSSCGERTTYETIKGRMTPRIQGWASLANRERHPRWALGVACEAEDATLTARFTVSDAGTREEMTLETGSRRPASR